MNYFDQQILAGLTKVPTPTHPGTLIVTGDAQPVFTGNNPGDTIMAACLYGKGKVFVAAHDCYLSWLHEMNRSEATEKFMRNLKFWLCGDSHLSDSKIIELGELVRSGKDFNEYRLIKWSHSYEPSEQTQQSLLNFIENGGALFAASTPWGYLQIYAGKTLQDLVLHNFLKNFMGILFTSQLLYLSDEMDVTMNRSKHSHFDMALKRVTENPTKIEKYLSTINCGIGQLNKEGVLSDNKILELKDMVLIECSNSGWNPVPAKNKPVKTREEKNATRLLGQCMVLAEGEKAPGVDHFPGDYEKLPDLLENVELELTCNFAERLSTGYFLPAGVPLVVDVKQDITKGWMLRIGAHTDDLTNCSDFNRWPCITQCDVLNTGRACFSSPYGGLIYLESPGQGQIKLCLKNVLEAPFYDLTKPETIRDWNRRRNSPGLWAELAAENIIFTTPSDCIRHIDNPSEILKFWDDVVRTHHECRGTNVKKNRRERVVNDKQPSAGYMHSGYPIVTHLDCCERTHQECIFDLEKLKPNGNWGLFHELGHNMQRSEWTFDGAIEVTVNIFSMHATKFIIGQDVIEQQWVKGNRASFAKYFSKTPTYDDWKQEAGMGLMPFVQLIKHFGWEPMHKFMKDYETDIDANSPNLPKNNQDKIDQWVLRYSKIVGRNIKPQFNMFGIPVSRFVDDELQDLQPWCPREEQDPNIFFSK